MSERASERRRERVIYQWNLYSAPSR